MWRPSQPPRAANPLGWSSWTRAAWLMLRGSTWRVALPVALVVGTVLAGVNQGAELIAGEADTATALRMAANYAIPYVVSSVGFLSAHRHDAPGGETGGPVQQQ